MSNTDNPALTIHRAHRLGDRVPTPLLISVRDEFPHGLELEDALQVHTEDANALEEVLWKAIPGGTYDALLRAMLLRRASHFVIPFADQVKP
jgi:hypothetical protein